MLTDWVVAFVFTQLFELPLYWRATKGRLWVGFLASTFTHPVVWFVFPLLMQVGVEYWPMVAAAEVFAVLAEAAWLKVMRVERPLLWSLAANGCSFTLGMVMRELVGFP